MRARTLNFREVVAGAEIAFCSVSESARGVVHWPHKHAGKDQVYIVGRRNCLGPFIDLPAEDSLKVYEIRPCAELSDGLCATVHIDDHLAFCSHARHIFIKFHCGLVVAVGKVYFKSVGAPALHHVESLLRIFFHGFSQNPQYDFYVFGFCVVD